MKSKIRANYHWVIALMVLLEMLIYGGIINNLNGMFLIPVSEDLGFSRSSFSLAMTIKPLVTFGVGMFSSAMFMRFGFRKLVPIGLIAAALGLFLMSRSQGIVGIGFGAAILGMCEALYSVVAATRIIGDWFHRYRGIVLGIVTAATGLGGSLVCVAEAWIIEQYDWRMAYLFCAVLMVLAAVVVLLLAKNRPDQMGLRPFGEGLLPIRERHRAGMSQDSWAGFTLSQLIRKPTFYLMLLCTLLGNLALYLAFTVVVPHMQDCGLGATEAASVQSTMLLMLAVAKLSVGGLSDLIGGKNVTLLCVACSVVGLWLLADVQTFSGGLVAIVIYSMCLPQTTITVPLLTTSLFGYRAHDSAMSIFLSMVSVGAMVAAPICNMAYDILGSYSPVFRVAAALGAATIVLYLILYRMAARDKKKWLAEQAEKANEKAQAVI